MLRRATVAELIALDEERSESDPEYAEEEDDEVDADEMLPVYGTAGGRDVAEDIVGEVVSR